MRKAVLSIAPWAWVGIILAGSFLPYRDKQLFHTVGRLHSFLHVVMFFVAAVLLGSRARTISRLMLSMCMVLALGFFVEVGEHLAYHSYLEWKDIVVDCLAALSGTIVVHLWLRHAHQSPTEPQRCVNSSQ